MNRLTISIIACLAAIAAVAQDKTDIEVSYTAMSPNFKNGEVDVKNQYVLLANTSESKFFSPRTEYLDSLKSTPEGVAKLNEMSRAAYLGGKMDDIPRKDGSYYVTKSGTTNTIRYYDNAGLDNYYYDDTAEDWAWELSDSTKNILGYECVAATADYHGRKWVVWFSPEIPIFNGPWKLGGLPGLILEASTDDGKYSFLATGIQQSSKPIVPIYLVEQYEKTDRKGFLKAKRAFLDNPISKINAAMGSKGVTIVDSADGRMFLDRSTIDLIETDY